MTMLAPDLRGCPEHGLADYRVYDYGHRVERRCLVCQRNRSAVHHNNGPRCRRGHLKTPWTWRRYGRGPFRCLTCQYLRNRERRALSEAQQETETAA